METTSAFYEDASVFAKAVHKEYPWMKLAYNLSPSFNWDACGMNDSEIESFIQRIGELGYVWQFITLAGFHLNSLATTMFARKFEKQGMLGYVENIQRIERDEEVETLKHQKWSGAYLRDYELNTVTNGMSSTIAMSDGVTEKQFCK